MAHADDFVPDDLTSDGGFGRDWVPLGDVPDDPLFSIADAYKRFKQAVGRQREDGESMFLNRDRTRCYTYSCLLTDFKRLCDVVGCSVPLGPHGIRVLGYNLSRHGNGVDLTVAHGGWTSAAHSRYARFALSQVLGVPAGMLGATNQFDAKRTVALVRGTRGTGYRVASPEDVTPDSSELTEDEDEDESMPRVSAVPDGYVRVDRTTDAGRDYLVVKAPDGTICRSLAEAWRHAAGAPGNTPGSPRRTPRSRRTPNRVRPSPVRQATLSLTPPAVSFAQPLSDSDPPSDQSERPLPVWDQPVDDLSDAVVEKDRPPTRRPPVQRRRQ